MQDDPGRPGRGPGLRSWWRKPELHRSGHDTRRVSWLELFYDLVFVVVISRLAHHLTAHPDWGTLLQFALLFIPVWWVWIGGTYYNERFETFDVSFRVFTFAQMLAVAAMAASAEYGLDKTARAFALSYVAARAIITLMWWRAGRHNPQVRPITDVYVAGFSVSLVCWTVAAFLPLGPLGLALRGAGLLFDLCTPLLTLRRQAVLFPATARKLPERFGLFMIIVLGESLVGTVNGLADAGSAGAVSLIRFVLGVLLGFGLWWVYFDFLGRREPRAGPSSAFWSYLHLPLVMAIAAVGALITHTIDLGGGAPEAQIRWMLAGAFALAYACFTALEFTLEPDDPPIVSVRTVTWLRLGTVALALLLPLTPLPLAGVAAGLALLAGVHMWYGSRAWYGSEYGVTNREQH